MEATAVRTRAGGEVAVGAQDIEELGTRLRGRLVRPGDQGYDEARSVWNGMIDRRPALIARCAGAGDVIQAVRFARDHDLLLAVRGGGHNIAGNAVCDGGMMIDLSPMRSVRVNVLKRTARVEPGATLGEVDRETQAFGLATPLGINSTTGIAGLTLGGGFGWLSRRLGLTIDNLLAVDVVTADGELVQADLDDNADLFWAVRGGGGNFGVITSFKYRLHEVGPQVLAGLIVHPLDAARDVLHFYRDFIKTTPEEFVCWFVIRQAPPLPFLAPEWHGKEILVLAVCWSKEVSEGERIAKPLRAYGKPLADIVARMPYTAWQTILDPLLAPGARNYWKSHDFLELSDGLIDTLIDHARTIPDPQTEIAFAQLGGAVTRVGRADTPFGHRDAEFVMNVHCRWSDPAKDQACIGWARELFQSAAPFATGGVYVNFLTQEEQDRVMLAYGGNFDRLRDLKRKFDPKNLFRLNQNIRPA